MFKRESLQEHLERIKYVSKYQINETPKYKSLIGDSEFDRLPEYLMREEDTTSGKTTDNTTSISQEPLPDSTPIQPQQTTPEKNVEITNSDTTAPTADQSTVAPPQEVPQEKESSPEKKVMELQLDALKKMSYKIEDLGNVVDSLNQRMERYSHEVEKVKEPSDNEKFNNRKLDSHPYYFNLNDLWKNNNFNARMDQFSKGYYKTEDGYIADFDDLPRLAPHEVKASFDV